MSSPKLNYLVLVGCIFLYAAVIIMGIDREDWADSFCLVGYNKSHSYPYAN